MIASSRCSESNMRLVSWNCRGATTDKIAVLLRLAPDIAVISEVTKPAAIAIPNASVGWTGADGVNGLAIVGFNGWKVESTFDGIDRHVLAASVGRALERLTVVGVWMLPVKRDYVGPFLRALKNLAPQLEG